MMSWIKQAMATALLAFSLSLAVSPSHAMTLYVAPDGRNEWSGLLEKPNADLTDGPKATLTAARDAIRSLKQQGPLAEPVRVVIGHGVYSMAGPIAFEPRDSGTPEAPITYEAAPGAHPTFEGGRPLTGFAPDANGLWTLKLPEVASGQYNFEQLFVDGRRAIRARSPNDGYYHVLSKCEVARDPVTGRIDNVSQRCFYGRPEEVAAWANEPNVELVTYQGWEASRKKVAGVDRATGIVSLTAPIYWPFNTFAPSQRYHVENFKTALDQPGEWFLDRKDGTLYYWPLPGQVLGKTGVYAPVVDQFVQFNGDPTTQGLKVEYITLRGLGFRHGQYLLPPEGQGDKQAAFTVPCAITADGSQHATLDQIEIAHVGLGGVWWRRGCSDCSLTHSYLHDLGGAGVKIGFTEEYHETHLRSHHITVDNNIIYQAGKIFYAATGVWIGRQSGDNRVTHNDISDQTYTGISVGWTWSYDPNRCNNNKILFNHVHHIGKCVLSDLGGIYLLGIQPGTDVSGNVIHDLYSYDYDLSGAQGLYLDQSSSSMTLTNNLVYDTKSGAFQLNYGYNNIVQNNIFACGMEGQMRYARAEGHLGFNMNRNILYWAEGPMFIGPGWAPGVKSVEMSRNLYWNPTQPPTPFPGDLTLAQWQAVGMDAGSVWADPLFMDAAQLDFRLKPDSPALQLGFKPFDYAKAGLYGDDAWVQLPKTFQYASVKLATPPPEPPPLFLNEGFEDTPVGHGPRLAQVVSDGELITVSADRASTGTHSLKFQDASGLSAPYLPLISYSPSHVDGLTIVSFDILTDPQTSFWHEWRSRGNPYQIGPSLQIIHGKLILNGQPVMDIPPDQWIHFEIIAGVGKASSGSWDLKVSIPDQPEQRFDAIAFGTPKLDRLDEVMFSSNGSEPSTFYLDQIQLSQYVKRAVPAPPAPPAVMPTPAAEAPTTPTLQVEVATTPTLQIETPTLTLTTATLRIEVPTTPTLTVELPTTPTLPVETTATTVTASP